MLTVLLATFNGQGVLPPVLDAYCRQVDAPADWTLVVVDNGSTDRTGEVLSAYADCLPLTRLFEAEPGKNRALNRAIQQIDLNRELIILTDDDAIPEPDFLAQWAQVGRSRREDEIYAGHIELFFEEDRPVQVDQYAAHFKEIYAENIGADRPIMPAEIFGPNMAVRGSTLRNGIRFDENIGPNGKQADYPMGSETEFCLRAARECGLNALFVSGPKVRHIVRKNQMEESFILGRAFRHGRGVALQQALQTGRAPGWRSQLNHFLQSLTCLAGNASAGDKKWQRAWHRGFLDGARTAAIRPRRSLPEQATSIQQVPVRFA